MLGFNTELSSSGISSGILESPSSDMSSWRDMGLVGRGWTAETEV